MVKAALVVLIAALVSLSGPVAYAACTPGAGQVSFFVDANFKGACVTKGIGNYATANAIGLPNDSISSVKLGPGAQVELCKDVNFGGDCILLSQSSSFINDRQVGNDAVSSAKVQAAATAQCSPGAGQACFCTDANFLGQCVTKPVGNYPTADALGIPNDSLSSVKLGPGVQVELCKDVYYGGDCILQTVSTGLLNGSQVPNDSVSSAKVQATGTAECPPSANQVSFYTDANYLGQCVTKDIGDYATSESIGLPNDSISAVKLGPGTKVELCKDVNFGGDCILVTSNTPFLNDKQVGNDSVTSAKVEALSSPDCSATVPSGQACMCSDANYLGQCVTKPIGTYSDATALAPLTERSISSIGLASGVQVCGCSLDNFGGNCEAITSSTPNLGSLNPSLNDWISSVKVQTEGSACTTGSGSGSGSTGFGLIQVSNCDTDHRTVNLWTKDTTMNGPWVPQGTLDQQYSSDFGSCPTGSPKTITLTNGHEIEFVAVDPLNVACGNMNDPTVGACQRALPVTILGLTGGPADPITVK